MVKNKEIYKCNHCGIVAEVIHSGGGKMICCGEPMVLLQEKTADSSTEKHVPVIEKIDGGYKVTVGSTPHPMAEEHFIEWIELDLDGKSCRKFLSPGNEPSAVFMCGHHKKVSAREYCNLHGLWKADYKKE